MTTLTLRSILKQSKALKTEEQIELAGTLDPLK